MTSAWQAWCARQASRPSPHASITPAAATAFALLGGLIVALTWQQPNQVGTGTFLVLWLLRTSAKLNLFWGVRNLSEQFLPTHLAYLESFFRRRAMNAFWPVSVAAACAALAWLVARALDPATTAPQAVGLTLVSTLLAMAIVEHLMLVLPLDTTALWRWALRADKRGQAFTAGLRSQPPLP